MIHVRSGPWLRCAHAMIFTLLAVNITVLIKWTLHESRPRGEMFEFLLEVTCHQMAERSHTIYGEQMPVCARCFGFTMGACLASASMIVVPLIPCGVIRMSTAVVVFVIMDWWLGLSGFIPDEWCLWRTCTGFLGGIAIYAILTVTSAKISDVIVPGHLQIGRIVQG